MNRYPWIRLAAVGLLFVAALALAARGTALAQQGPLLTSALVSELPADPSAPAWQQAPVLEVPLGPQPVALPRLLDVSVATLAVRSLNDGKQIAFLLEWTDLSRDAHATRPDQFRDAAAILFAVGDFLPNICMGTPGQQTNLWHWKADWQEDIDKGFQDVVDAYPNFYKDSYPFATGQPPFRVPADFGSAEAQQYFIALAAGNPFAKPDRSSPVEELVAAGFGTATHKTEQNVGGRGVWADGHWRVLFTRPLAAPDTASANLAGRSEVPLAFAVWDGAHQEAGARKQLSSFVTARIEGAREAVPPPYLVGGAVVVLLATAAVLLWLRSRRRSAA